MALGAGKVRQGFTIVELLIVIVVIAILAVIVTVAYNGVTQRAHASALQNDLSQAATSLGTIQATIGTYPADQASAGLKSSSGNTLTYNVDVNNTNYCLQNQGSNMSYFITNSNTTPQMGTCSGTTGVPNNGTPPAPAPIVAATGIPYTAHYNANLQVPVPAGVTAGSLVVIALGAEWSSTGAQPSISSVNAPGFTVATASAATTSDGSYVEGTFFLYKYAAQSESGTYAVTLNNVGGGSTTESAAIAYRVTGGPTTGNPFTDTFKSGSGQSSSASVASFTPGGDSSLLLASVWGEDNPVTTVPAGWHIENKTSDSGWGNMLVASSQQTTAASTGPLTFSGSNADIIIAVIGTIRP